MRRWSWQETVAEAEIAEHDADATAHASKFALYLLADGTIPLSAAATLDWDGRSSIYSSSDGNLALTDSAGTDFELLQFGDTSSSFPALKRNAASLQARLADDSDYADVDVKNLTYSVQTIGPTPTTSTPAGTTQTINWDDGPVQVLDLEDATGDVTVTFSNPVDGGCYILKVIQDSAVARDITWPGTVKWTDGVTPVVSAGNDAEDIFSFIYDGSNYYGSVSQNNS